MTMTESSRFHLYVVLHGKFEYIDKVGTACAGYRVDQLIG